MRSVVAIVALTRALVRTTIIGGRIESRLVMSTVRLVRAHRAAVRIWICATQTRIDKSARRLETGRRRVQRCSYIFRFYMLTLSAARDTDEPRSAVPRRSGGQKARRSNMVRFGLH